MKRRRYAVASAIAVAGFAALFSVLPSQGAGLEVKIAGFRYRPTVIRLDVGGAATFENETKFTHTATCRGCRLDTGDIQPGMFKTLTFPKAGRFLLFCRYHEAQGMVAVVTVGGGGPAPQPTVSPTA